MHKIWRLHQGSSNILPKLCWRSSQLKIFFYWKFWKCLKRPLFLTCVHAQHRAHFFHHIKSYFWLRQPRVFPVWSQFCCACQGKKSLTIFSGNTVEAMLIFCVVIILRMSSIFFSFHFLSCCPFWGCLYFLVNFLATWGSIVKVLYTLQDYENDLAQFLDNFWAKIFYKHWGGVKIRVF